MRVFISMSQKWCKKKSTWKMNLNADRLRNLTSQQKGWKKRQWAVLKARRMSLFGEQWKTFQSTLPRKNMNLPYSILRTERIFDRRSFMYSKIFLKKLYKNLVADIVTLHLLRPNWSIIRGKANLWKMHENGKIAVFEGKWRRFRILPKV